MITFTTQQMCGLSLPRTHTHRHTHQSHAVWWWLFCWQCNSSVSMMYFHLLVSQTIFSVCMYRLAGFSLILDLFLSCLHWHWILAIFRQDASTQMPCKLFSAIAHENNKKTAGRIFLPFDNRAYFPTRMITTCSLIEWILLVCLGWFIGVYDEQHQRPYGIGPMHTKLREEAFPACEQGRWIDDSSMR